MDLDPDPDVDPDVDPDPAISVTDLLKMTKKKQIFLKVFAYYFWEVLVHHFQR